MKRFLFIIAASLYSSFIVQAQDSTVKRKQIFVKANTLFLPIGVINAGAEYQISKKTTLQADVFISPWKSFGGKYAQVYMVGFDARYYFNEAFTHWYVGANIAASRFKVQKWNYWSDAPYQFTQDSPIYISSDLYQDGFGLFIGAVAGYQWQLNENWNLDLFIGAGTMQSFYRGYHKTLGVRYDTDPTRDLNRSGEWIPYRGGLMISYRL